MPPPANDSELAFASIGEIARLFRARKLSPVELTKLLLARIDQLNPKLNAYLTVTADLALAQAKKAEGELYSPRNKKDRGLLHGIPISLKDNIYTAEVRTTAGSKILENFIPQRDATVVTQLKNAGAILLGKTNMHEFAYGVTSNNPHYGPVRNPWALERIAGGSSGGSAAAVSAGLCYASIGTDTGGSVRIPAALCGVVGLKPGIGRVSAQDVVPLSPMLDFVGPIARTVRDTAITLAAIFTGGRREKSPAARWKKRRRRFRLGVPNEIFFSVNSAEVGQVFGKALGFAQKRFADVVEVEIPLLESTEDAGNKIAWPEATLYHEQSGWFPRFEQQYGEDVRSRLEAGKSVTAVAYLEALYTRGRFIQAFHAALADSRIDALVVPTTPIAAPLIGEDQTSIGGKNFSTRALLLRHNRPANLAAVPAISVPCGFSSAGLPIGLQLIGAVTDESLLLEIAHTFEQSIPRGFPPVF